MINQAVCRVKFSANVPLLSKEPPARVVLQAPFNARALTVMPSLSPPSRSLSRPATRLLIVVAVLATLAALPRVQAATPPAAMASSVAGAPASAPPAKIAKSPSPSPTCQAIMQRLSGSLAGTPSNADKPGAVLVDVDKAGVTMACSHSDAVAIPVPGNGKAR